MGHDNVHQIVNMSSRATTLFCTYIVAVSPVFIYNRKVTWIFVSVDLIQNMLAYARRVPNKPGSRNVIENITY